MAVAPTILPPPSFAERIEQLIRLAEQQLLTERQLVQAVQVLAQRVSAAAATEAATGQAPAAGFSAGPVFVAPPDLQQWNALLGASGLALATIDPQAVVVDTLIPQGAQGFQSAYSVPAGTFAVAMAPFLGQFSYHAPGLTVLGYLNYGVSADQLLVTDGPLPCDQDLEIPLHVVGTHRIVHNVTLIFNNASRYAVRGRFSTVFLSITEAQWNKYYLPFSKQVLGWIQAVTAGRFGGALGVGGSQE